MGTEARILAGILVFIITGGLIWIAKHITNSKKHPCKDDVVFKDVCVERSGNLSDCIEGEIRDSKERYTELKSDMQRGFCEIKELIKEQKQ